MATLDKMQDSDTETASPIDPTFIHLSGVLPALPPPPPRIPPTPEIQIVIIHITPPRHSG